MRKWTRSVPILAFLGLVVFLAIGLTRDSKLIPSQMIDRQMPAFNLPALRAGEAPVSNLDLQGQITLVNIFGSWCVACVVEHPTLMKIARRGEVQLLGVNWRDTPNAATAWLQRYGDPYDLIASDASSELAIELGVTGAPETFIVGPHGRIRYKQVGPINDEVLEQTIMPIVKAIAAEGE